ncbi:MAG: hypothetical protein HXX10_07600 [Rhodoplanes sp.]|uniref:hypothetical protein n=1 Tax=Rhodoplanes sp. TaxID=1968906 RepID=UPI001822FA26|nr:hypothetical protein [Rhodoplanes sp.]NVO13885.1 hypothetical protein [Rhodoplanes sp.]
MARGGYRPGAGRPAGPRPAKIVTELEKAAKAAALVARAERAERAAAPPSLPQSPPAPGVSMLTGGDPSAVAVPPPGGFKTALEFAMAVINDPAAAMNARTALAIAAMPYQHPKLAEKTTKKDEAAAAARKAASAGRYAPPAPPRLAVDNTTA